MCEGTDTTSVIVDKDAKHNKYLITDEASMANRQRLECLNTKDRRKMAATGCAISPTQIRHSQMKRNQSVLEKCSNG